MLVLQIALHFASEKQERPGSPGVSLVLLDLSQLPVGDPTPRRQLSVLFPDFAKYATEVLTENKFETKLVTFFETGMNTSSRYTVAIHILTLLAYCEPSPLTSEFIAGSVNTNPVVIRRLLGTLREAGLVTSQSGPGGGWRLLRDAKKISLRDIYSAMEGASLFPLHAATPNPLCPVGKTIQSMLAVQFNSAREAMERHLGRTTIAALVEMVKSSPQ